MLPQEVKAEKGSRMVLKGVEVWIIHNFTTERGNVYDTGDRAFILPNGEPVRDRTLLDLLPDQHKQRALAWWDQEFGDHTMEVPVEDTAQPSVADLMAENKALREQIALMQADPPGRQEFFEPEKGTQVAKDAKGRFQAKSKVDRGSEVLKNMGISG